MSVVISGCFVKYFRSGELFFILCFLKKQQHKNKTRNRLTLKLRSLWLRSLCAVKYTECTSVNECFRLFLRFKSRAYFQLSVSSDCKMASQHRHSLPSSSTACYSTTTSLQLSNHCRHKATNPKHNQPTE